MASVAARKLPVKPLLIFKILGIHAGLQHIGSKAYSQGHQHMNQEGHQDKMSR